MNNIVNSFISLYHKFTAKKPERFYTIDGFNMDLGEGHMLSLLQKSHPMYDRFVPFLGVLSERYKNVGKKKYLIDIGANVGDTTAALIRHTSADVICVEPTKKFYDLCKKNIQGFGEKYASRVTLIQGYISSQEHESFSSIVINGTAVKQSTNGPAEAPTFTIPSLCNKIKISLAEVVLVKSDTDGYDSDCIQSFGESLKHISPLLFWENEVDSIEQLDKYLNMVDYLLKCGYDDFFVFDNFGNYLCHVGSDGFKEVNYYLGRILRGNSTRSFYYVDVLASKKENVHICKKTIADYLEVFNNNYHKLKDDQ